MYGTDPKNIKFTVSAYTFNKEGNLITKVDSNNPDPMKVIHYKKSLKDNQIRYSDDLGLNINIKKLDRQHVIDHVFLILNIDNLGATINSLGELNYAKFRLTDFITDQTLDSSEITKTYRLEDLKDGNLDSEIKQSAFIVGYYLHKNKECGWMLESLKVAKNVSGENYKHLHLIFEKLIKSSLEDLQKGFEDILDDTAIYSGMKGDKSINKSNLRDIPNLKDASHLKEASKIKSDISSKRDEKLLMFLEEEAKKDMTTERNKIFSRTFGPIKLNINDYQEAVVKTIEDEIKKQNMEIFFSFEYGYQILISGKQFEKTKHIWKLHDIQSFIIQASPKPLELIQQENNESAIDYEKKDYDD